jgi:hypothetical protein
LRCGRSSPPGVRPSRSLRARRRGPPSSATDLQRTSWPTDLPRPISQGGVGLPRAPPAGRRVSPPARVTAPAGGSPRRSGVAVSLPPRPAPRCRPGAAPLTLPAPVAHHRAEAGFVRQPPGGGKTSEKAALC